jgi:hypothetical protein
MRTAVFATRLGTAALVVLAGACGGGGSSNGGGPSGGDGGGGGGGTCGPGAILQVPSPYMLNTAQQDPGGFYADGTGLVMELLPDPNQASDVTKVPALIDTAPPGGGSPQTIFTFAPGEAPEVIADATGVYFATLAPSTGEAVQALPRAGGSPHAVVMTPGSIVHEFAVGGGSVYYVALTSTGDEAVYSVPVGGGQPTQLSDRGASATPDHLAVDGGKVYWIDDVIGSPSPDLGVFSMAPGGMPTKVGTIPGSIAGNVSELAVSAGTIVFATYDLMSDSAALYRLPANGAPTMLASDGGSPFVIDGGNVYYATKTGPARVPLAGGASASLGKTTIGAVTGIAVSGSTLYWVDAGQCVYQTSK